MYWAQKWTPEGIRKGVEYTRLAIEADPVYADAYVGLAYLFSVMGSFGGLAPMEAFSKAKAAAVKALEIDPSLADAHAALAYVRLVYDWDWHGAEADCRRALELAPHLPGGHYVYSHWCRTLGRSEEATVEARRALDLDRDRVPRARFFVHARGHRSGRPRLFGFGPKGGGRFVVTARLHCQFRMQNAPSRGHLLAIHLLFRRTCFWLRRMPEKACPRRQRRKLRRLLLFVKMTHLPELLWGGSVR